MRKDLAEQRLAGASQVNQINRPAYMLRKIGDQRHPGIGAQRPVIRHRQVEVAVRSSRTPCQ